MCLFLAFLFSLAVSYSDCAIEIEACDMTELYLLLKKPSPTSESLGFVRVKFFFDVYTFIFLL